MGHEIITYRDRHAMIHDMDLWVIRHFLLSEAEACDNSELAAFACGWDWVGPGVYIGKDFDAYFDGDQARESAFLKLLEGARVRIESFGDAVPLNYLVTNLQSSLACFGGDLPVSGLVQQLEKLKGLFTGARPVV